MRSKLQDLYERLGGGLDAEMMEMEMAADRDSLYRVRSRLISPSSVLQLNTDNVQITPRRRMSIMLARTFKRVYPYLNLAYELMTVGYDISFAFGRTKWWRWWMRLVGIQVVRAGAVDELSGRAFGLDTWLVSVVLRTNINVKANDDFPCSQSSPPHPEFSKSFYHFYDPSSSFSLFQPAY